MPIRGGGRFVAGPVLIRWRFIGTAHGISGKNPKIDLERLADQETGEHSLVLHGGSGLPPETVQAAIIPGEA